MEELLAYQEEEEKEEKNVIAVIGKERCDFLYFLTKFGKKAKKKILVIDNSYINDYYQSFGIDDGVIEYEYLTVCHNYIVSEDQFDMYDYIFVYAGLNFNGLRDYDFNCCITTVWDNMVEIKLIKSFLDYIEKKNPDIQHAVLYRDIVSKKVSIETICNDIGVNPNWIAEINIDTNDLSLYNSLLRNNFADVKNSSDDMQQAVFSLGSAIYGLNKKNAHKIFFSK